jgi:3-deoxy-D-manno-octulosonic-acid transferase
MTDAMFVYRLCTLSALFAVGPFLAAKAALGSHGISERLGFVERVRRDDKPVVWFHAASMGELKVVRALHRALLVERDFSSVVSTVTATGKKLAREVVPDLPVFLTPVDAAPFVGRTFKRIEPDALILVETEIWPELIAAAHARRVPVAVVNARVSEGSFKRYLSARALIAPLLKRFSLVAAQTDADAARYVALGADAARVRVVGNSKVDALADAEPPDRSATRRRFGFAQDRKVIVCGCTRPGEEVIVIEAYSMLRDLPVDLVIAPRHLDRVERVMHLVRSGGYAVRLRSDDSGFDPGGNSIAVLDTMGELSELYAAADAAFVGGTFVPVGGHDPLEPAAVSVPVAFGPYTQNVAASVRALASNGGGKAVASAAELAAWWRKMLTDENARRKAGEGARRAVAQLAGSSTRTARLVACLVSR